jgi:hypothetical protein
MTIDSIITAVLREAGIKEAVYANEKIIEITAVLKEKKAIYVNEKIIEELNALENKRKNFFKEFLVIAKENAETLKEMKKLLDENNLLKDDNLVPQFFNQFLNGHVVEIEGETICSLMTEPKGHVLQQLGIDDKYDFLFIKLKKQDEKSISLVEDYRTKMHTRVINLLKKFIPDIELNLKKWWPNLHSIKYDMDINMTENMKEQILKILKELTIPIT